VNGVTFLPIVDRELRVAARKSSTIWLRIAAALAAVVIGCGFLAVSTLGGGPVGASTIGRGLFSVLTWIGLVTALLAGVFFTSDCLSEERRSGTLGFLFLTELSGYDIVLGKLLATSLRGSYALLAVCPILAITLLLGGVSPGAFWRTLLALAHALGFSLAVGLVVSAMSRDSQKALAGTLAVLVILVLGGPAADGVWAGVRGRSFEPTLSLVSPGYVFLSAQASNASRFWMGLGIGQAVAWVCLAGASLLVPRTWVDRGRRSGGGGTRWTQWWRYGGTKRRSRLRRLADVNPMLWLVCRDRWAAVSFWSPALLLAGGLALAGLTPARVELWYVWRFISSALTLWLYLMMASQASRLFLEAKRSGLLELLLATPLTGTQIVQGHWRGLLRLHGPALAVWLAAQLIGTVMGEYTSWRNISAVTSQGQSGVTVTHQTVIVAPGGPPGGITSSGVVGGAPVGVIAGLLGLSGVVGVVANLTALAWFGMWAGLTSNGPNWAILKTLLFVQIIPGFVIWFASMLAVPLLLMPQMIRGGLTGAPGNLIVWSLVLPTVVALLLLVAKDAGFVLWSRRRLGSEFRLRATWIVGGILPLPARPISAPVAAPPVIDLSRQP
jgi:ABC-type transport system involved in cytochrome c biogenesis permease component